MPSIRLCIPIGDLLLSMQVVFHKSPWHTQESLRNLGLSGCLPCFRISANASNNYFSSGTPGRIILPMYHFSQNFNELPVK